MSKKIKNTISILIVTILTLICLAPKAEAASFSITSGISTTTVGKSYTISISAKGLTGKFNVTHSSNVSVNVDSVWVDNGTPDSTIRVTAKSAGKATVTLTPSDVSSASSGNPVSLSPKTDTVTIKSKSSSSSSSSGSSSNKKSSTSTKSNDTEKPQFRDVDETVYATSSGINIRSSYSTSSSAIGTLNTGDELTRTAIASNAVDGITWSRVTYNGQTAYVSSSYLSTEKPEESSDKTLKSLTIDGEYSLTPEFSADVTEYTLNVPEEVTTLDIDAVPTDDNAKVEITGNDQLLDGVNTIEIKVTAEDGTARTYKISVTKGAFSNIGLTELSIDGYTLTPEFSTDVYEYTLEINDLTVTNLNVNAIADQENAIVEIVGNTDLKPGENIITILVKSEEGEEVATYQIVVNIVEKPEEQLISGINNNDLFLYGGIALGVIIILIIIVAVVRHKRKANRNIDEEQYYSGFSSLNKDSDNKETDSKNKFGDTQDLKDIVNNKNMPEDTQESEETDPVKKHRRSVIEENFGADINNEEDNDDKNGRKKGKHF